MIDNPNVVLIGGGSGSAALYPELIRHTSNALAIVSMSDSGGSTGDISSQLGIPPVGDLRNVMMSASDNPAIRAMRMHRLGGIGHLRGHTWGNITIAACINKYGLQEGIKQAALILQVPGKVLPVTLDSHMLIMQDGKAIIRGEHTIDTHTIIDSDVDVWLEPEPHVNPEAEAAIRSADIIVVAPGSVYTSLLPALSVAGVREAMAANPCPKVLIANLVTEAHQTNGWHVVDFVASLSHHQVPLNYVLYNTQRPSERKLKNYLHEGERPVDISEDRFAEIPEVRCIGTHLIADDIEQHDQNDAIERSYIRHDAEEVRRQLWKILEQVSTMTS
jgi:uncharacterized cofD-like protein